jgi:hypothetical protein
MVLQLRQILESQGWKMEREGGTACFYNHAPWIAPLAYVHIVFKGASEQALDDCNSKLSLPQHWTEFLSVQNGAILFSGAMSMYGANETGAPFNRKGDFERGPFRITDSNLSWPKVRQSEVVIGGYSYDGTLAVLNKEDGAVSAMTKGSYNLRATWSGSEEWITGEMDRLAKLFDQSGKISVDKQKTLPGEIQRGKSSPKAVAGTH